MIAYMLDRRHSAQVIAISISYEHPRGRIPSERGKATNRRRLLVLVQSNHQHDILTLIVKPCLWMIDYRISV